MSRPRGWEEYLFKEHQAFAVSPLRGLQLFDVFIKVGGNNIMPGPLKLRKIISSFFGCGLRDGKVNKEDLEVLDYLEEAHRKFLSKSNRSDRSHSSNFDDDSEELPIRREDLCTIEESFKANSKILATLMDFVNLKSSSTKAVTFKLEHMFRHYVDQAELGKALNVWKPDLERIARHGKAVSKLTGYLDLWLVTEILFAEQLTVDGTSSRDASAGVRAGPLVAAATGGVVPPGTGGTLEVERSSDAEKKYTGGNGGIPFAIRTTLLRYNSKGELVHDEDGAKRFSVFRKFARKSERSRPKFSDPVRHPVYNMGDLFEAVPSNDSNPDAESYIPLELDLQEQDAEASPA